MPSLTRVDVLGLGLNAMDYITVVPQFPQPGKKTAIREVRLEPGGQVATALTVCRRFGLQARYLGSVGSDELGRLQIESLEKEGIDASLVRVVEDTTTQLAFIVLEQSVGERTILWHRDERLTFPENEVTREIVASGRILHLDGRDSAAALRAAEWARETHIPVVIDIDKIYDASTVQLLNLVDYLVAAEELATEMTGFENAEDAASALAERFPRATTGVTLGRAGAVFVLEGMPERSPAFEVDIRDTTGAGDVFHGAFIFGVLQEWDIRKTIRFAHATAAMKCRQYGARAGIPTLAEVESFLETARER
jgi:sulfofructose kinase